MSEDVMQAFRAPLIGLPLSRLWRGHGSAIFLEFGRLAPSTRTRRDGTPHDPSGEFGLMIQWSWRVERGSSIICGSWSEEPLWEPIFDLLRSQAVVDLSLLGRIPEIVVTLSESLHVLSFMTAEGDPQWSLFDRRSTNALRTLSVQKGRLIVDQAAYPET
jgi:hypothetical protein